MTSAMLPTVLQTGIADLDDQHEQIFRLIQNIKAALIGTRTTPQLAMTLLNKLGMEMAMHFAWEEQAAQRIGLPFAPHAREHRRIERFLLVRTEECLRDRSNLAALLVYLDRQFEAHVTHYDQALGNELHAFAAGEAQSVASC